VTDEFLPTLLYGNVSDVDLNIVFTDRSGLGLRIPEETLTTSPAFPNDRPGIPRLFRFFLIVIFIFIVIVFIVFKLLIIISAYLELPLILGKETPRDKDPSSFIQRRSPPFRPSTYTTSESYRIPNLPRGKRRGRRGGLPEGRLGRKRVGWVVTAQRIPGGSGRRCEFSAGESSHPLCPNSAIDRMQQGE
jgi:hypothetical protein